MIDWNAPDDDGWDAGTWDADDRAVAASLALSRQRRATAAKAMLWLLVLPLGIQTLFVLTGVAAVWGIGAVVVPAVVVGIVVRGR